MPLILQSKIVFNNFFNHTIIFTFIYLYIFHILLLSFPKAPRFSLTGIELKDKFKDEYLKQNDYYYQEDAKLKEIKEKKILNEAQFLQVRRNHREFLNKERERTRMIKAETENPNKNMTHDTPGPGAYFPEYDTVYESAPSYTLKGKLKSELFEINNNFNDPTKLLDYDANLNVLPNLPDFNIVKESFPRVIFPKYPRFKDNNALNTFSNFKVNDVNYEPDKTGFQLVEINHDKNKTY